MLAYRRFVLFSVDVCKHNTPLEADIENVIHGCNVLFKGIKIPHRKEEINPRT